jgi:membrane protease YdiL (CAAX protease family)
MLISVINGGRLSLFWRIAIVVGGATLVWSLVYRVGDAWFGTGYDRIRHIVSAVLTSALVVPGVVLAWRVLDRCPWCALRNPWSRAGLRSLLFGMGCWLIPAGVGIAVCVGRGWTEITLRTSIGEVVLVTAGLLPLVFLYEALPEELVFRGYVYRNLATALPRWGAVFAQAALFTVWATVIGAAESVDRVLLFFVFGLIQGMFRSATGMLWPAIGFHLAFQVVAQLFSTDQGQFTIGEPAVLQIAVFGLLPFATSVLILRARTDWRVREPDPSSSRR